MSISNLTARHVEAVLIQGAFAPIIKSFASDMNLDIGRGNPGPARFRAWASAAQTQKARMEPRLNTSILTCSSLPVCANHRYLLHRSTHPCICISSHNVWAFRLARSFRSCLLWSITDRTAPDGFSKPHCREVWRPSCTCSTSYRGTTQNLDQVLRHRGHSCSHRHKRVATSDC